MLTSFILALLLHYAYLANASGCDYEILNCHREEVICDGEDKLLLDSKNSRDETLCIAIQNNDYKNLQNYKVEVEMLSLESEEGTNSGYLGIIFNFIDPMNYDFVFLEIHSVPPLPTQLANNTPAFTSGYCLQGSCVRDERTIITRAIEGTIYHSFKLVIDNNSVQSTKVFVDGKLVGSFQEHFAPKLKGGVFVLNQYHITGLFKNFRIEPCDSFNSEGACIEDCTPGSYVVTSKDSYEMLSSNLKMITEANCLLNGLKVPCITSGDFTAGWPSAGFEIHGNNVNIGEFEMKFGGKIGPSAVEIEFTRENEWDANCDVELLKNGIVIASVPDNEGDSKGSRTKSITMVSDGDILTLREGGDGSVCGVHIYGLKIGCNGLCDLPFTIRDAGYNDMYRGWYDTRACGSCNDYCRWVGNSGSGGNPAEQTSHDNGLGKGRSRWVCQMAKNDNKDFSSVGKFVYPKCNK